VEPGDLRSQIRPKYGLPELLEKVRAQTPARLFAGRSGAAYRTGTHLTLREAHAAARDAVRAELDIFHTSAFASKWKVFEAESRATSKDEFLLRPDLGRHLTDLSKEEIRKRCTQGRDLQIVIGDGLSATAVSAQVPKLLPLLYAGAESRGWSVGEVFVVRYCRVGIINDIGALLSPQVVVLLIGERPGLATAESLSAYMSHCPKTEDTDANRNLVSNIHSRGVTPERAAERILNLAAAMMKMHTSGFQLREQLPMTNQNELVG
jgi:ethanolamine ammonia-lyase small subunit